MEKKQLKKDIKMKLRFDEIASEILMRARNKLTHSRVSTQAICSVNNCSNDGSSARNRSFHYFIILNYILQRFYILLSIWISVYWHCLHCVKLSLKTISHCETPQR